MLSCAGNRYLSTPAMDYIAQNGTRFERAYCTNPVCLPSRFSLLTGRMPSYVNIKSNEWKNETTGIPQSLFHNGIGYLFKEAGYDAVYGGKVHLPGFSPEDIGFDILTSDERQGLSDKCYDYIKNHDSGKPFFMVASFINPHDICFMAINDFETRDFEERIIGFLRKNNLPPEEIEQMLMGPRLLNSIVESADSYEANKFFDEICPPLPSNYEPQENEPEAIGIMLDQRPFRRNARQNYSDNRWRLHRWAYCRLTEIVDKEIQKLINALKECGKEEDTVIIFSSDHGDHDSSHRLEHKDALYEEACRIPFIISQKGTTTGGIVDKTHLISNGLDLIPTICDYAGIVPPETDREGRSIKPLMEKKENIDWRNTVKIESEFGRAIVKGKFKYVLYFEGKNREQLYDLEEDPGETRNGIYDADKQAVADELRKEFSKMFEV